MELNKIINAHACIFHNWEQLLKVSKCGCFYCLKIFNPKEIKKWCDSEKTAICPYCGIDSIIYDSK